MRRMHGRLLVGVRRVEALVAHPKSLCRCRCKQIRVPSLEVLQKASIPP
jgi:hypothetical protein